MAAHADELDHENGVSKMRTWLGDNRTAVSLVAVSVVAGVLLVSQATTGGLIPTAPATPNAATPNSSNPNGGESMSTHTQNAVLHSSEKSFANDVLRAEVPVLVDFYADWCGPCRLLAPVLEELAEETQDAKIVKVNIDEDPGLAAEYQITSIPTLLVFDDGQAVGRHVGLASKRQLQDLLNR
jgi:thioredoxin 1